MTTEQEVKQPDPKASTALAVVDFGDDVGAGMQDFTREHFKLPFVRVLHYECPQIEVGEAKFIDGAKPGMLYNTATNEIYDGTAGLGFIPVHVDHSFIEQVPFNDGGGFVGVRTPKDDLVIKLQAQQGRFCKLKTTEGTELTETFTVYGVYCAQGMRPFQGATTFSSARIPVYQAWAGRANGIEYLDPKGNKIVPPLWAHKMILRSMPDKAKKTGKKYFNYNLTYDGLEGKPVNALMRRTDSLYIACAEFYKNIEEGRVILNRDEQAEDTKPAGDTDIPF